MRILRIMLRVLGGLGVLLLTLLTLAVSGVNMAMVTQYWALIVAGGAGLFLLVALLWGGLVYLARKRLPRRAIRLQLIIACVFLAQMPLHFLFNAAFSWSARIYVQRHLPQLDAYHKEKGRYPGTIDEVVTDKGIVPTLMGQWSSYSVFNERSSFRISVYRPMASGQFVFLPDANAWETRK